MASDPLGGSTGILTRTARAALVLLTLLDPATVLADRSRNNPNADWLPAAVTWSDAELIEIELLDHVYQPNELVLQQDRPYRIRFVNHSQRSTHDLFDLEFFHAVVFERLELDGSVIVTPHIHSLKMRPGSRAELFLVPRIAGHYDVFCSVPGHREEGMEGVFTITSEGI